MENATGEAARGTVLRWLRVCLAESPSLHVCRDWGASLRRAPDSRSLPSGHGVPRSSTRRADRLTQRARLLSPNEARSGNAPAAAGATTCASCLVSRPTGANIGLLLKRTRER